MRTFFILLVTGSFFIFSSLTTQVAAASSCEELRVVSGNNRFAPSTVTLVARASGDDLSYRFYFGDGKEQESATPEVTHRYDVSGTFTSRVEIKDAAGTWKSGPSCQTIFSILPSPLESQKSGCANVFINGSNYAPAGTDVKFLVTGYDNKSGIREYRIDFGNGQVRQSNVGNFNITFPTPGTYTIKGYIKDSKNNEIGGTGSCQTPLYITGEPIVTQPATGTPTWFTVAGILSAVCLFFIARNYSHR